MEPTIRRLCAVLNDWQPLPGATITVATDDSEPAAMPKLREAVNASFQCASDLAPDSESLLSHLRDTSIGALLTKRASVVARTDDRIMSRQADEPNAGQAGSHAQPPTTSSVAVRPVLKKNGRCVATPSSDSSRSPSTGPPAASRPLHVRQKLGLHNTTTLNAPIPPPLGLTLATPQRSASAPKKAQPKAAAPGATTTGQSATAHATWTVQQLKAECKERGLKVSGTKDVLISRLVDDDSVTRPAKVQKTTVQPKGPSQETDVVSADNLQRTAPKPVRAMPSPAASTAPKSVTFSPDTFAAETVAPQAEPRAPAWPGEAPSSWLDEASKLKPAAQALVDAAFKRFDVDVDGGLSGAELDAYNRATGNGELDEESLEFLLSGQFGRHTRSGGLDVSGFRLYFEYALSEAFDETVGDLRSLSMHV